MPFLSNKFLMDIASTFFNEERDSILFFSASFSFLIATRWRN